MKSSSPFGRQIIELLPYLFRECARREQNPLSKGQITLPQMVVLEALVRTSRVSMKEIARLLGVQMSSATVLVDRLVREKMLDRLHDENDRRVVWVRLTGKGRRVVRQTLDEKSCSMERVFACLSNAERIQYLKILRKVCDDLRKKGEKRRA